MLYVGFFGYFGMLYRVKYSCFCNEFVMFLDEGSLGGSVGNKGLS